MIRRVPVLVWFLVPTAIILGVGVWVLSKGTTLVDETKPQAVSRPVAGVQEFAIAGQDHVGAGTPVTTYTSNPPTSGPHWPAPVKNGIYDTQIPDEQLVHNLEHGHIWISYLPEEEIAESTSGAMSGISADEKKKLEELVSEDNWKIVMASRPQNDAKIVLAAWGRLLKMNEVDEV
ncbi:MAG: DUF3105 domain-containing protein, partial [Candidatus Curtissbacteria bacterium]